MTKCNHGKDIDFYCAECDQENLQAKIDGNNAKVVIPKEDLEEFTWGQLFHFAKDSQSSNVYQQKKIENLELELNRTQSELEVANHDIKRGEDLLHTQGSILAKTMEDFIELTDELKEYKVAIRWMTESVEDSIAHEVFFGWDHATGYAEHKTAIDRALKEPKCT